MILEELVNMSRELGRPENDYVILGEGNTSAAVSRDAFYVKASGSYLAAASETTFVQVDRLRAVSLLDGPDLPEAEIKVALRKACVGPETDLQPSIETVFHAYLLGLPGVKFVAHTHPTAVNSILFSVNAEQIVTSRLCVHEVIYCGAQPVFVPACPPGLALARAVRSAVSAYVSRSNCPPRQIFLQNHGLVALGATAAECLEITAMACKTARIIIGASTLGGVRFCDLEGAEKIYDSRP